MAAMSVAARVADEIGCKLGHEVSGWRIHQPWLIGGYSMCSHLDLHGIRRLRGSFRVVSNSPRLAEIHLSPGVA
jgi:hypothetical protein